MSGNKTVAGEASVEKFIAGLADEEQKADSKKLLELFSKITGQKPIMWGGSIIGFGSAKLTYASGRVVDWPDVAFSPRKGKISLYVTFEADKLTPQFPNLGKYKIGKGCIYINKLSDVDLKELEKLVKVAFKLGFQSPARSDGKEQIVKLER